MNRSLQEAAKIHTVSMSSLIMATVSSSVSKILVSWFGSLTDASSEITAIPLEKKFSSEANISGFITGHFAASLIVTATKSAEKTISMRKHHSVSFYKQLIKTFLISGSLNKARAKGDFCAVLKELKSAVAEPSNSFRLKTTAD
jgi:hypothetical protein